MIHDICCFEKNVVAASTTKEQNKAYQRVLCDLGQKITDMLLGDCLALICAQQPGRLNNGGLGLFLLSEVPCLSQTGTPI